MKVTDAVRTRIEIKEFADRPVDQRTVREILDAGRLAPSGRNLQHWRFILIDDPSALAELADRSPTGGWVAKAAFAVAVCTDPRYSFNELDAGRAITHMQLVAWEHDVGSRIYTVDQPAVDEFLGLPDDYELTLVAGFGYPAQEVVGRKDREPLEAVAYRERFGESLEI